MRSGGKQRGGGAVFSERQHNGAGISRGLELRIDRLVEQMTTTPEGLEVLRAMRREQRKLLVVTGVIAFTAGMSIAATICSVVGGQ
jgi:chorismate synthase